jgi:hypothetical protein
MRERRAEFLETQQEAVGYRCGRGQCGLLSTYYYLLSPRSGR